MATLALLRRSILFGTMVMCTRIPDNLINFLKKLHIKSLLLVKIEIALFSGTLPNIAVTVQVYGFSLSHKKIDGDIVNTLLTHRAMGMSYNTMIIIVHSLGTHCLLCFDVRLRRG